jgi:hypothetical protein
MGGLENRAAARPGRRLTIKIVVFSALGALGAIAVAKFGWEAAQSWNAYARTADQREFNAAADQFINGVYEILLERLATDNALQAPGPADGAVTAKIEAHRQTVRTLYEPALAMIERRSFAGRDTLVSDLKIRIRNADEVRRQADSAIKLVREQRDETLRKTFAPIMTDMVNASLGLWYRAVYTTAKGDAELAQFAVIKEIGWKMREFSGLARAAVAGAIAEGKPVSPERAAVFSDNRTKVSAVWMMLENLTSDPQTHPAILEAMRRAREGYFNGFLPLSAEMRKGWRCRPVPDIGRAMGGDHQSADRCVARRHEGCG